MAIRWEVEVEGLRRWGWALWDWVLRLGREARSGVLWGVGGELGRGGSGGRMVRALTLEGGWGVCGGGWGAGLVALVGGVVE